MRFHYVDTFVGEGLLGNPGAVALVEKFPSDEVLNTHAREQGLPATVFVLPVENEFHLRWFTPLESDFCGHGTLAASHVLYETALVPEDQPIRFRSRAGLLTASRQREWISLDLPALSLQPSPRTAQLEEVLGARVVEAVNAEGRVLVELESEQVVRDLRPDVSVLRARVEQSVIVTARAKTPYDFVSRYFKTSGDEDPVTGSAHCALGPYWSARMQTPELLAYQASERGGELRVHHRGERVTVAGKTKSALLSGVTSV